MLRSFRHSHKTQNTIDQGLRKILECWLRHPRGVQSAGSQRQHNKSHQGTARFLLLALLIGRENGGGLFGSRGGGRLGLRSL